MGTHHLVHNIGPLLAFHHGTVDVGNEPVSIRNAYMRMQRKLGLEMDDQSCGQRIYSRKYLKNVKNPIEIRPPGSNRDFFALRAENTRERVLLVRPDNALLDQRDGPAIGCGVSKSVTVSISAGFDSRCKLFNCLDYGPT